ncbi:DNA cytosine methyltransferase [Pseudomonas viridiflava]|uniref:DNA cytosine methyltransferase n=1 Tax=Pseudomonas viridiflava TaxID=33069 RepID=UPI000F033AF2|nr:DNA cytosine methyltransferase [Pseudomonas viridiflava]
MDSSVEPPTIVDLFCGCGGFSLGAELAGFHTLAAVDIDSTIQSGYRKNYPNTKAIEGNVAEITQDDWRQLIGTTRPDGVIGGPPCQGFSRIGKRLKDDPRNNLVHHFYRHVRELDPKFFIMENVQGILDEDNVDTLMQGIEQVSGRFKILGPFVINAADYGAATNRYRVLVIGYNPLEMSQLSIEQFTGQKVERLTTVRDAISDLPPQVKGASSVDFSWSKYPRAKRAGISDYALAMRQPPPPGIGWPEAVSKLKLGLVSGLAETKHTALVVARYLAVVPGKTDLVSKSHKLRWEGLSPTLRAGTGADKGSFQAVRPLHPILGRVINVREAARLQGFPDWYVFHPTKWHSFRMIGNSVSPLVSYGVLSEVYKSLKVSEKISVA